MNNDTLIEQNDFFEVICDEYKKSNYVLSIDNIFLSRILGNIAITKYN